MKKASSRKLTLGKIKIARLSTTKQEVANQQALAPTYTGCSLFKCPPPQDGRN
ncbi:hypothetical protein [Chitinophaga ginsengisoli]|uniref:Uncharacterized protein n=1 Tax=Chitinophaga ginsengisoli TaxID=363837 RepID=A0A2P8FZL1_9BACT|nr:hypothetical protein [Chitinophaga ginsengisoli]PSL27085.1 hypothetical protein CLV42_110239 [Chitinophaga ginsengisoli]